MKTKKFPKGLITQAYFLVISLYPIARYFSDEYSLAFIFLAAIIVFSIWCRNVSLSVSVVDAIPQIVGLALIAAPVLYSAAVSNNFTLAKYFLLFGLTIASFSLHALITKNDRITRTISLTSFVFALLLSVFLFSQFLPQFETDSTLAVNPFEISDRFRAMFPHANDLAIFAASFFLLLLSDFKQSSFLGKISRLFSLSIFVAAVIRSASDTGYLVLIFSMLWALGFHHTLKYALITLFLTQIALQAVWAVLIMDLLGSGSVWWRFAVSDFVLSEASLVSFSPAAIEVFSTWTHSALLDILATYGFVAAILITAYILYIVRQLKVEFAIAILLFVNVGLIQPIGAMPASMLFAVFAFVYFASEREKRANISSTNGPPYRLNTNLSGTSCA